MKTPTHFVITFIAVMFLILPGCEKEKPVVVSQVPKETPRAAPASDAPIRWSAPEGWKPLQPTQIQYAAFQIANEPPLVLTVTQLAQQSVLANVNRWRGQLGLQPITEDQLSKTVTEIKLPDATAQTVDLLGPASADKPAMRMLAAIIPHGQQMWFFKIMGPADAVGKHKNDFADFIASIRFGDSPRG